MSYTKQAGIPCNDGETVVLLDSGSYIAVSCSVQRNAMSNLIDFTPQARWISNTGDAMHDASGRTVTTIKTHSMSPDDVDRLTPSTVAKECLLVVLGEPLTMDPNNSSISIIPWSADVVGQCSIKNAIAAASAAAPNVQEIL